MKFVSAVLLLSLCLALTVWGNDKNASKGKDAKARPASVQTQADGEQVYKANCTRCHNTPPTLTERQTKVVVSHMRVRAGIPAADAEAVLKYLSETARRD